jgi:uncharacterized radical SAM superfamily Fe-S cluster-containing enzyme
MNVKFERGRNGKKYTAILPDGRRVSFGAVGYQQYRDTTPLKLYSALDHNDEARRARYYMRHPKNYPYPSPDWFSKHYLW